MRIRLPIALSLALTGCLPVPEKVVTKAEYDRLYDGITYFQAREIIGAPGEELSSGTMEAVPGVMPSMTTKMYSWQNWDGSNMNAIFQNGKLVNKAQFGLE